MQGDGQGVFVHMPELLKHSFRLRAGVDEHQRHPRGLDALVDLPNGVAGAVAGPGQTLAGVEHGERRGRAGGGHHQLRHLARPALGRQPAAQFIGIAHGGRQAHHGHLRRQGAQPRQPQRQQIAALRGDDRMQLVQHHPPQGGEKMLPIGARQQERQLLGRGEQDLRGIAPLALALGGGGVASARLHPHPQAHVRNRRLQIARHIHSQRLQGRDVEGMQALALGALARRQFDEAG